MAEALNFKVQYYFPGRFAWSFAISLVSFYSIVEVKYWLLVITIVLIIVCMTTRHGVEINTSQKWFKEYIWVLGVKSGETVKYSVVEYLFINRSKVSQTASSRFQTTTITKDEFRGFIKFDGDEKIHILTRSNHDKLVKEMTKTAQLLKARLFDYSPGHAVQIN